MICSSGKVAFRNEDAAQKSTQGLRKNKRLDLRPYLCDQCGQWHRATCNKNHSLSGTQRKKYKKNFQKLKTKLKRLSI